MKKFVKTLSVISAAVTALSLVACSTEQQESAFDNPLPWSDSVASYEKLDYAVAVYDTSKSAAEDKRVKIGDGELSFTLNEGAQSGYTTIDMSFTVTYDNIENAGNDAGLTDTITSHVAFEPNSLAAKYMEKTVTLADRKDQTNLSYAITADYFDTHKAMFKYTKQDGAKEKSRSLSSNATHDNEMMFYLARAQAIDESSSTIFRMMNIFDSFTYGKTSSYSITVTGGSKRKTVVGDFVKDFGINAVTDEKTGEVSYPVTAIYTNIMINAEEHGPAYSVLYSKDSFVKNGKEHKKIPLKIDYSTYNGSATYRHTSYTLKACSFDKPAAQ